MRIALDVTQTCRERAGCAWYADSLAQALVQYAPEHSFVLYHQFANWHNEDTLKGTVIRSRNVESPFVGTPAEVSRTTWSKLMAGADLPGDPHVVHSNSFQAPALGRVPLVFTVYDVSFWIYPEFTTEENRLLCQRGLLQALRHASGFAFISQSARSEFEKLFPDWLEKSGRPWAVTPLGARVRSSVETPFPLEEHRLLPGSYWLSVGSLEPRKNIGALLDAHQAYWERSQRRLPLVIAGGAGWNSQDVKKRIAALAESGRVVPVGYVRDDQLPSLYARATALIFPSLYEGFGLPILEAFSHRCPVITAKHTSLTEVAGDAVLEINPRDPASLCEAMLKLETTPEHSARLREAGARRAGLFSWEKTAAETLRLYEQVIKPGSDSDFPRAATHR